MKEHYSINPQQDGSCRISTLLDGPNRIYWSKDAFGFTDDNEFEPFEKETVAGNPLRNRRCYYHIFSDAGGYTVTAPHLLFADGRINTRDLGGYNTTDERFFVKPGVLFRSADLNMLDEQRLALVKSLNLKTIVDFRQPAEVQSRPDPELRGATNINLSPLLDSDEMKHINLSSERLQAMRDSDTAEIYDYMDSVYGTVALNNAAYRQFFEILLDRESAPLLFHCVAGKDRTGVAAVLILLALDVPRKTAVEDYLQSAEARRRVVEEYRNVLSKTLSEQHACRVAQLIFGVQRQSIERTLSAIEARYGNWNDYFAQELGLSAAALAELRNRYLVPHFMKEPK